MKIGPDFFVVFFPVAAVEGGLIGYGSFKGAGGLGVIGDDTGDGDGLHIFDILPAGGLDFGGLTGEADGGQAFGAGEDDAAVLVVPGVGFVLAHDRELDAVDGFQFFQGEAQGHGREDIYFHQGLTAGVVGAQGVVAIPGQGEAGEKGVGEAGIVFGPMVSYKFRLPAFLPKFGVVGCEAR